MTTLDSRTLSVMNRLGRLYAGHGSDAALREARELYQAAANEDEQSRLAWWWHEGCRDYADSMRSLEAACDALVSKAI